MYSDPSPINYLTPVDKSIWPEDLDNEILLNTLELDKLNAYQDLVPSGDGFFDFLPGITVDPRFGRIIFTKVEPFGEFLFGLLDNPSSAKENYKIDNTFNANQKICFQRNVYSYKSSSS